MSSHAVARCECDEPLTDYYVGGALPGEAGKCENPALIIYACCGICRAVRCRSSKTSSCKYCAAVYKSEVRKVCQRGIVDAAAPGGTLTMTAPGVGRHCRRHRRCNGDGDHCDPCPCSVDHFDAAEWNATLGERWNRLLQAIRRGEASPKRNGQRDPQDVQYFRVYEPQKRGLLHIHAVLVSGDGEPIRLSERKLRALLIAHGFGHSFKWDPMTASKHEAQKLGGYLAKYVSKTTDERASVPWRHPSEDPHRGRMFRTWVASRRWRCSMRDVRKGLVARRSASLPRRHDVEVERQRVLAVGEPLDSFLSGYTVERAPPTCATSQLALFPIANGRG